MSSLLIRIAGAVFFLLGSAWIVAGFYVDQMLVWLSGGLAAAAGMGLLAVAPRLGERSSHSE